MTRSRSIDLGTNMPGNNEHNTQRSSPPANATGGLMAEALAALRARTPARLVVGRAGTGYRTSTLLELREDHAAAVDAVQAELDIVRDLGQEFVQRHGLFEVTTRARDKAEYLRRPELGRMLGPHSGTSIVQRCPKNSVVQVAIGDGLSAAAVTEQVPALLPHLEAGCKRRGWSFGQPFAIRYCRVGVLNDIGRLLDPEIVVLLIGERPGLATAVSLSAYLAYRPRAEHTDANRNLISNIHARGVGPDAAADRILAFAEQMRKQHTSGVAVKEQFPAAALPPSATPRAID
jgi:ethanolamine ammonia-lyase small subunit